MSAVLSDTVTVPVEAVVEALATLEAVGSLVDWVHGTTPSRVSEWLDKQGEPLAAAASGLSVDEWRASRGEHEPADALYVAVWRRGANLRADLCTTAAGATAFFRQEAAEAE